MTKLKIKYDDFMGIAELAAYLGKSKQSISNMKKRGKLPKPIAELAMSPIWLKSQFKDWNKK